MTATVSKKVLFLFGGTPHYYNAILNLIQRLPNYAVTVVSPMAQSRTFGEGVHQSTDGIEFEHVQLEEKQNADNSLAFKGLAEFLADSRPAILVTVMPYMQELFSNEDVVRVIKQHQIKIILKDHPFGLPMYGSLKKNHGLLSDPKTVRAVKYLLRKHIPRRLVALFAKFAIARRRWKHRKRIAATTRELEQRAELFRSPDALVCYVDEAFKVFGSYGVPSSRIFITGNSPDTQAWFAAQANVMKTGPINRKPFRILHIGRLVQWKRVDLLLKAFKLVLKTFPESELDIIGYGPKEDDWKAEAVSLGISSQVTFSGGVYKPKCLASHFMKASVYVLAGMGGLSINDAMCFSLPVICSVCDGTEKHLVFENENGSYFREGDAVDLSRKIMEMFNQPEEMKKMGEKSRKIVETSVNERTVIAGYQRAFNFVLSHNSSVNE